MASMCECVCVCVYLDILRFVSFLITWLDLHLEMSFYRMCIANTPLHTWIDLDRYVERYLDRLIMIDRYKEIYIYIYIYI